MAGLVRLTSVWTGFVGAPGYSNFYAEHNGVSAQEVANQFADDIKDFWDALNGYLPNEAVVTVDPIWRSINPANGQILAEGNVETPPAATTGLFEGSYAGNTGVAVDWHTSAFIDGHRLKGRTYLVPFANCFSGEGDLSSIARQAIIDAAVALYDNSSIMVVWHRPKGAVAGSSSQITSVTVTDRAAILRSRSM